MSEDFARHEFADPITSSLVLTMIPWHPKLDEDGKWQKVPSLASGFHYRDFEYGKPVVPFDQWGWRYDRWGCKVPCDDRPGYVTSFESGVITSTTRTAASWRGWSRSASSCCRRPRYRPASPAGGTTSSTAAT